MKALNCHCFKLFQEEGGNVLKELTIFGTPLMSLRQHLVGLAAKTGSVAYVMEEGHYNA